MVEIVATTSLPVDRLTAIDCNAAARAKNCRTFVFTPSVINFVFWNFVIQPFFLLSSFLGGKKVTEIMNKDHA